jgi:NO-binding membrane sensor protein with MHYT domain
MAEWSMHFFGMLAFDMGMPVPYDVPITLASLRNSCSRTNSRDG